MIKPKILIVDDEENILLLIKESLIEISKEIKTFNRAQKAFECFKNEKFDLIITDLKMPEMDGLELVKNIRNIDSDVSIIVMTGFLTVDNAINAIKAGANEYINKPIKPFDIRRIVKRIIEDKTIRQENIELKNKLKEQISFSQYITQSSKIKDIFQKLSKVVTEDTTILLTGETGTGKDLLARLIHYNSHKKHGPFIVFNAAGRPENLIESELFGFEKGSFTGASKSSKGAIEQASNGSLFLDEIGELNQNIQVKLLRFVQDKKFTPIGGKEKDSNARLIAATHRNLEEMIDNSLFRKDLYYRLKVVHFHLPPLRERTEDIYMIAHHYLNEFNLRYHKNIRFSPDCYDMLSRHPWMGNVRELKNFIERTVLFSEEEYIESIDLQNPSKNSKSEAIDKDLPKLSELNRRYIEKVLKITSGNKKKASKILGIDQSTIWRKLKK